MLPLYAALVKGFFAEEGLTVQGLMVDTRGAVEQGKPHFLYVKTDKGLTEADFGFIDDQLHLSLAITPSGRDYDYLRRRTGVSSRIDRTGLHLERLPQRVEMISTWPNSVRVPSRRKVTPRAGLDGGTARRELGGLTPGRPARSLCGPPDVAMVQSTVSFAKTSSDSFGGPVAIA
jgi:hypothetical protein